MLLNCFLSFHSWVVYFFVNSRKNLPRASKWSLKIHIKHILTALKLIWENLQQDPKLFIEPYNKLRGQWYVYVVSDVTISHDSRIRFSSIIKDKCGLYFVWTVWQFSNGTCRSRKRRIVGEAAEIAVAYICSPCENHNEAG